MPKFVYSPPPKAVADLWTSFQEEVGRRRYFLRKEARTLRERARRIQRERSETSRP